jgi:hypothetical protein
MKKSLLTIEDVEPGIQKVTLNLDALYSDENRRQRFEAKYLQFLDSDRTHPKIIGRMNNSITYLTENIIPKKKDERSSLLLIFGNPASHSVASRMFFAFEGAGRDHRLWKILSEASILSFPSLPTAVSQSDLNERNQLRKKGLFELSYNTLFRIGLAVFYTMPSPASSTSWAGVTGLHRLFEREALDKISEWEKERVGEIIRNFVSCDGAVIAFHKEAYHAIKSLESPDYTLAKAKGGHLVGNCQCDAGVTVFCVPPTRILWGYLDLLRDFRDRILSN